MVRMAEEATGTDALLVPRRDIPWKNITGFLSPWARTFLIDNRASRRFLSMRLESEEEDQLYIRDQFEARLLSLPAADRRFWLSEFDFMGKLLTVSQMAIYTPALLQLAFLMPRKLVFCRRKAVELFLWSHMPDRSEFMQRQSRRYIRSSVLLYPSYLLFRMGGQFRDLLLRSRDQSARANREKVLISVRAVQLMDASEISSRFKKEEEYMEELAFLRAQCRHYRISVSEICKVPAEKALQFRDSFSEGKLSLSEA